MKSLERDQMKTNSLAELLRELGDLREPPGGYDKVVDRFSNIAVLDHEMKTQYRRAVIALMHPDPLTVRIDLQQIERDYFAYGQLIAASADAQRDLDGNGNVLANAAPISEQDQVAFEKQCEALRERVLDALLASGYLASEPSWLL